MINYKERPEHRKIIIKLLKENPFLDLLDIINGVAEKMTGINLSNETKVQAKKMLDEGFNRKRILKRKLF